MGAGKSKLGAEAARALHLNFYDLDKEISAWYGDSIAALFKQKGELFFREKEQEFLQKYLAEKNRILSLGGGTLQTTDLALDIKKNNLLIFIKTPFHIIIKRVIGDTRRPLVNEQNGSTLAPSDAIRKLHALYEKRLPVYSMAHITFIPKDNWPVHTTVLHLVKTIREYTCNNNA